MALGLLGIAGKGLKALGSRKKKPVNTTKLMARTDQPDKSQNPDISFDTVTPSTPLIPKGSAIDSLETGGPANFYTIRTKLITVDQILKDNLILDKVAVAIKKQEDEKEARKKAEEEIEGKKPKDKLDLPVPKQVRSMWDHIQPFFKSLLIGLLLTQGLKFLPLLAKIVPLLMKAADFILEWGGKFLNVLVTVVDAGYKAYDWTRGKIEDVFGEEGAKKFDKIAGILNTVMNHIFTIGLGIIALSNEWNREDRLRKTQKQQEQQEIKNKRRKIKEQDPEWKKRRNQRLEQRRSFRRQQRINNLRNRIGLVKPKGEVPPSTPKRRNFLGVDWGKRTGQVGEFLTDKGKGIQRGVTGALEAGGDLFNKRISQPIGNLLENVNPSKWLQKLAEAGDDVIGSRGAQRLLALIKSPTLKRWLGKAPLLGDAIIFVSDLLRGVHWTRALMRTSTAFAIDYGFGALIGATVLASPFTGGASLALTAALTAAYMGADMAGGFAIGKMKGDKTDYHAGDGIGQVLGDMLSNALGLPKKAGDSFGGGEKKDRFSTNFLGGSLPKVDPEKIMKGLSDEEKAAIARVDSGKAGKGGEKSDKKLKRRIVGPSYKTGSLTTIGPDGKPMTADELEAARDSTGHSRGTGTIVVERKSSQATILPLDVNGVSKKVDSISEKASYEETDQAVAVVLVPDENDSGSIDSSGKGGLVLLPSGGGEDPHKKLYAGS